jgi:hypothetical protein
LSEENYEILIRLRGMFEEMLGIKMSINDALTLILYYIENEVKSDEFKPKLIKLLINAKSQQARQMGYQGLPTR